MKYKIITILITMFTMITGCQSTEIELPGVPINEYDKLLVTHVNYDKLTRIMSFKTENKSSETITTGLDFTIEKYENKTWNKTDLTDNLAFIEIALLLNPDETIEEKIDLSQIKPLYDGYYRIKKQYYSPDGFINQYIQFEVNDANFSNFSIYNTMKK